MTNEMIIRECTDKDEAAIGKLWEVCSLSRPYNPPEWDIGFCRKSDNSQLFVGECDGKIVATVMAGHDGHRGWLYYLGVDPDYRGRGYGETMVGHAENWLKGKGIWKMMLMIRETNEKVRRFYEKLGFEYTMSMVMNKQIAELDQHKK